LVRAGSLVLCQEMRKGPQEHPDMREVGSEVDCQLVS
jgi:hypothetical protein